MHFRKKIKEGKNTKLAQSMKNPCMGLKLFEYENAFNRTHWHFVYAKAAAARMWVENLSIVWVLMCWSFTFYIGNAEKLCYVCYSRPHSSNNGSIWIAGSSVFYYYCSLVGVPAHLQYSVSTGSRDPPHSVLPLNWTVSNFVAVSVSLWILLLWLPTLLNDNWRGNKK